LHSTRVCSIRKTLASLRPSLVGGVLVSEVERVPEAGVSVAKKEARVPFVDVQ
jgi:hypothetical protein